MAEELRVRLQQVQWRSWRGQGLTSNMKWVQRSAFTCFRRLCLRLFLPPVKAFQAKRLLEGASFAAWRAYSGSHFGESRLFIVWQAPKGNYPFLLDQWTTSRRRSRLWVLYILIHHVSSRWQAWTLRAIRTVRPCILVHAGWSERGNRRDGERQWGIKSLSLRARTTW